MPDANVVDGLRLKYSALVDDLDERGRRRWAATEAMAIGRGGIVAVAIATGLSDRTVKNGIQEIREATPIASGRQRKVGGGRKPLEYHCKDLPQAVERLVEPTERRDPQSPLRWTCKSLTNLQSELNRQGYQVGRTADSGGSNGHRNRLWKLQLQRLADETGMKIEVCHYPPGTSKWNKIEHRLFCHITRNWRGVPLETHQILVNLVSSTRTEEGLEVHCWLDSGTYETGRKVTDEEMSTVRIKRNTFHGDWNYEIQPHAKTSRR